MYKDIFVFVFNIFGISGKAIATILAKLVHVIAFAFVGLLYSLGIINGRSEGKVLYAISWSVLFAVMLYISIKIF